MQVGVAPPQPPSDFAVGKEALNMSPGKTVRVSPAVDVEAHASQRSAICKRHRICELRGHSRIRKDTVKSRPTGNPIPQGVEEHWQVLILVLGKPENLSQAALLTGCLAVGAKSEGGCGEYGGDAERHFGSGGRIGA